uniref:Uncharacterized protein n=1 Tax=Rhizophora mucronata TaxID=61149 RepID=A0A2P2QS90_RHIMU
MPAALCFCPSLMDTHTGTHAQRRIHSLLAVKLLQSHHLLRPLSLSKAHLIYSCFSFIYFIAFHSILFCSILRTPSVLSSMLLFSL